MFINDENGVTASSVRRQYQNRFPTWSQQLITILSGKAAPHQPPPAFVPGPVTIAVAAILQFPVNVGATVALVSAYPLAVVLMPISWLISVNALRKLQVVVAHHAVHNEIVWKQKRVNRVFQAIASAMGLAHHWDEYVDLHVNGHHNRKIFTTIKDPDAQFLVELGFEIGLTVEELRHRLWLTLVSPQFHWVFVRARARTNFVTAPRPRRLLAAAWIVLLLAGGFVAPTWIYVAAVAVPLLPLYHVSALLQFLTEHAWLVTDDKAGSKEEYAERTWGRFSIEPLPEANSDRKLREWLRWSVRTLFIQLPARFGVLVGDMPAHDLHHLHQSDHDWTHAIWHRQARIDLGDDGMSRREFYRLSDAIDHVFHGIGRGNG